MTASQETSAAILSDEERDWLRCMPTWSAANGVAIRAKFDALAAERERLKKELWSERGVMLDLSTERERLTEALGNIGRFAASHSGRDGQDAVLSALYRIAEECEATLAKDVPQ